MPKPLSSGIYPPFPFQATLMVKPGSEYAASNMTVGSNYTVKGWAGSCFEVTTNVPDDFTMIWHGWLKPI